MFVRCHIKVQNLKYIKKSIDRNIGKENKRALRINEEDVSRPFTVTVQYQVI